MVTVSKMLLNENINLNIGEKKKKEQKTQELQSRKQKKDVNLLRQEEDSRETEGPFRL